MVLFCIFTKFLPSLMPLQLVFYPVGALSRLTLSLLAAIGSTTEENPSPVIDAMFLSFGKVFLCFCCPSSYTRDTYIVAGTLRNARPFFFLSGPLVVYYLSTSSVSHRGCPDLPGFVPRIKTWRRMILYILLMSSLELLIGLPRL